MSKIDPYEYIGRAFICYENNPNILYNPPDWKHPEAHMEEFLYWIHVLPIPFLLYSPQKDCKITEYTTEIRDYNFWNAHIYDKFSIICNISLIILIICWIVFWIYKLLIKLSLIIKNIFIK